MGDPSDAADYFKKFIGGKSNEAFLCMYLDHRNHILDVVLEGEGTVDHAAVYPREMPPRPGAQGHGNHPCPQSPGWKPGTFRRGQGFDPTDFTGSHALGVKGS